MSTSRRFLFILSLGLLVSLATCQTEQSSLPTFIPIPTDPPVPTSQPAPTAEVAATAFEPIPTNTFTLPTPTTGFAPELRLAEDFESEATCLETFERIEASAYLFEDAFLLDVVAPDAIVTATCQSLVMGDFILEVDAELLEVPEEGSFYYGLVFRVSGEERYNFVYGSQGGYCAFYAVNDAFVPLTNSTDFLTQCWARPPEGVVAEGAVKLGVEAVADRMDLYLNGELIAVVRDHKLSEGLVGFIVATGPEGGLRVAFDNFRVLRP